MIALKIDTKFEAKLACASKKWHEKLGKFSPEHLKVSKLRPWWTSFCLKLKIYELKTYRGVMCHGNEEMIQNLKQNWLPFQSWHEEFDKFWSEQMKISKICTLIGFFWPKYIMLELKKCRTVRFDGTEYWCKIWRENDLCFQKWHRNLANFHESMLKNLKIGTLMGSFYLN